MPAPHGAGEEVLTIVTIEDILNTTADQEIVIDNPAAIKELLAASRNRYVPSMEDDTPPIPDTASRIRLSPVRSLPVEKNGHIIGTALGRIWSYEE